MELHQLNCFLAIIEEGGFNRATTRLHITQPALSYQIKQLESELGISLFHRRPGGVNPTEAGRVLAQHAREVLEAVRRTRRAVEMLSDGVTGEVRIGTVNSIGIYFLPHVLWTVKEKFPEVRPTVLYRHSNEILEALVSKKIDLAIVADPRPDRRLQFETVFEEQVSLVCGREHPLFGRSPLRPSEIRGQQFIALSVESPTGRLIQEHLVRLGVNVEPVVSTDNIETVKKMVEVGMGIAYMPDMVTRGEVPCDKATSGRLWRIQVGPPLLRRIVLCSWKSFEMSRAAREFVKELKALGQDWKGCLEAS